MIISALPGLVRTVGTFPMYLRYGQHLRWRDARLEQRLPVQSPRADRKGLLSPKRKSESSAFQAFMTPQKRAGAFSHPYAH